MRCPEEYGRHWRPKQRKSGWQEQKEEEAKEEAGKKREEKEKEKKQTQKKQKREKAIEVKRIVKEWEIWEEEEEAKKWVPEKFHK